MVAPGVVLVAVLDGSGGIGEVGDGAEGVEVVVGGALGEVIDGEEAIGAVAVGGDGIADGGVLLEDRAVVVGVAEEAVGAPLGDPETSEVEAEGPRVAAVDIDLEELVAGVVTEVEGGAVLGALDLVAVEVVGIGDGPAGIEVIDDLEQSVSVVVVVAAIDEGGVGRILRPLGFPVADGVEAVGGGPVGVDDLPQAVVEVVAVGGGLECAAVGLVLERSVAVGVVVVGEARKQARRRARGCRWR